jgi:hexosaminidase
MAKLFPDAYFHIGGDEVNPRDWSNQPGVQAFLKKHHLESAPRLQTYFNQRLQKILARHGKRMMGWDEILQSDLPKDVVIQSWRGQTALADVARKGYSGILSTGYYLDLMQPASAHYRTEPLAEAAGRLSPEETKRILGGEAAMWEELATAENLDAKLWPRLAAIAERFWSPASVNDIGSMYARLEPVNQWLEWLGLKQRSNLQLMRQRLVSGMPVAPLNAFASILEPVKGYERHRSGWGVTTPFNRLVDAIPPESDAAREFSDRVAQYLTAPSVPAEEGLRKSLAGWVEVVGAARPVLESNSLLLEDLPLADALATLCRRGGEALSYRTEAPPAGWKAQALADIKDASVHRAHLLIAIAPAVQKLAEAVPQ